MADIYEQNLASKSALTVNDYIRVVGSDNASYKQLVSDVAKKIIENYTGSSLAGSSQSVKSALDSLNSKIHTIDHEFKVAGGWTSGRVLGSRVAQVSTAVSLSSTQYILGIAITYIGDSSKFICTPFYANGTLYCNYYAASADACGENGTVVNVRLAYMQV